MTAKEFIEHYEMYLIGDIKQMSFIASLDKIYDIQGESIYDVKNKMAVPVVMSIFSALDIMGFLIRYNIISDNIDKELCKTCVNIKECTSLSPFNQYKFLNKSYFKSFIKIYRNRFAHSFFPSHFQLSFNDEDKNRDIFICINDNLVFNVARFYHDFMHFFQVLKKELKINVDKENKFEINVNALLNNYNKLSGLCDFINHLKKSYCLTSTSTTTQKTTITPFVTGSLAK